MGQLLSSISTFSMLDFNLTQKPVEMGGFSFQDDRSIPKFYVDFQHAGAWSDTIGRLTLILKSIGVTDLQLGDLALKLLFRG